MRAAPFVMAGLLLVAAGCTSSSTSAVPSHAPRTTVTASQTPSTGNREASWPTYGRDAARTGADPTSRSLGSVHTTWTSPTLDGAVYAQPLVVDDRVLVATENDSIYALDTATGDVLWRRNLGRP